MVAQTSASTAAIHSANFDLPGADHFCHPTAFDTALAAAHELAATKEQEKDEDSLITSVYLEKTQMPSEIPQKITITVDFG